MKIEAYLKNFYAGTKNPSLDVMQYLMKEFGNPEKNLKIIHIAGTNGKGSITEMLANILVKAGYRTGKFMSPHLVCYNERISLNHQNITDEEMESLILELMPKIEIYHQNHETKVTLFELETAMAILYFSRKQCDFVIMETGLGGLYDCTNIVNAQISIISSIGYDHMNILGNSLEEIARQKAGIIKENGDTIFVEQKESIDQMIEDICLKKNNTLHKIDPKKITKISYQTDFTIFSYENYADLEIALKGPKQVENATICLVCMDILNQKNYQISDEAIREGLKTVIHKGRFETLCEENPKVIFDGAHNEPAIEHLKNTIDLYYKDASKVLILSIFDTKDYRRILELLLQEEAIFIFTDGNEQGRFISKEILYDTAKKIANNKVFYRCKMKEAIELVKEKYHDYVTFIIGSFYVYEVVKKELEEVKYDTN